MWERRIAQLSLFENDELRNEFPLHKQTTADFSIFGFDRNKPHIISVKISGDKRNTNDFNNRIGNPQTITFDILRIRVVYRVILISDKSVHFTALKWITENMISTIEELFSLRGSQNLVKSVIHIEPRGLVGNRVLNPCNTGHNLDILVVAFILHSIRLRYNLARDAKNVSIMKIAGSDDVFTDDRFKLLFGNFLSDNDNLNHILCFYICILLKIPDLFR